MGLEWGFTSYLMTILCYVSFISIWTCWSYFDILWDLLPRAGERVANFTEGLIEKGHHRTFWEFISALAWSIIPENLKRTRIVLERLPMYCIFSMCRNMCDLDTNFETLYKRFCVLYPNRNLSQSIFWFSQNVHVKVLSNFPIVSFFNPLVT